MPEVSVIIPIYNAEKYLKECIDSVLQQTFRDFELILVNDGSQDSSLSICNEYMERDLRVKVISQTNCGVSVARNVGKTHAQGEYIIFIDADDRMKLEMLEIMLHFCKQNRADVAVCEVQNCNEDDEIKEIGNRNVAIELMSSDEAVRLLLMGEKILSGPWNKLIKKSVIRDIEYCAGRRMNEDKYFVLETLLKASKIVFCKEELYCYYIHQNSVSHKTFSPRWFDNAFFAKEIYNLILQERSFLEEEARFSMILTEYSLLRLMVKNSAYKEYKREFQDLVYDIKKAKVIDIFKWYQNSTKIGILMVKRSVPLFKIVMKAK